MKIISTITLARFEDGSVKQIVITPNLSTANIIDTPLAGLVWGEGFEPVYDSDEAAAKPEDIMEEVSEYFGVTVEQIKSESRKTEIKHARHVFVYLARQKTFMGWKSIGRYINRDHTSCIHSRRVIDELIFSDETVREQIADLQKNLGRFPDATQMPKHLRKKIVEMKTVAPPTDPEVRGILKDIGALKEKYSIKSQPLVRAKW